ncbi:MAG TPA: hypothetical protein DCE41_14875 [Cytophagales bacterium]|nr:hypothetical protein [Cytophagales bacterium]HAA22574.1 hypothetical protein [Cytophagales bacterium]HAP64714.1 hypothetical protein [Cytophagales bacterium]
MKIIFLTLLDLLLVNPIAAQIQKRVLYSEALGDSITVQLYDPAPEQNQKPIVYFTDGQKLLDNGSLDTLKALLSHEGIAPAVWVFVSTVVNGADKRDEYFFCNEHYLTFFEEELIPTVEEALRGNYSVTDRSLVGFSFGGLNAAYFSARSQAFQGYGLLSPVIYPRQEILAKELAFSTQSGLRIFLSTGRQDAEEYVQQLVGYYQGRDHTIREWQTQGGHTFDNWNRQLLPLMQFLHTAEE